jgi:hypothetical protein
MSGMKFLTICLLLSFYPVFGETSVSEILAKGMKKISVEKTSISEEDQKALLNEAATLLTKHINFRTDGTASAHYSYGERRTVEWQELVVSDMVVQPVTEADKLNGITKKYSVFFGCNAHRAWDSKTSRWSEWLAHGFAEFPLGIVFQFKNGEWTSVAPALLKYFSPGPGLSTDAAKPRPAGKTNNLPPGMQKAK